VAVTFAFIVGAAIALAAPPPKATPAAKPAAAPAAKPNPIVMVKKLDGTTVRGQLTSAEPDQILIKTPGAAGETVTIRWSQIAHVSNGLTQEQSAAQRKGLHKDELCPDCHGDRGVPCKDCHGTGFDQTKLVTCKDCGGAGVLFCPNKKCDDGQIDCPAPCLKLTVGRWTKRPDGLRVRTFPGGGWVSEHHSANCSTRRVGLKANVRPATARRRSTAPTAPGWVTRSARPAISKARRARRVRRAKAGARHARRAARPA
jgi:hypothetical protein